MSEEKVYDLIIVGGGPAGLSAGIYASRSELKTLVLEADEVGGRASDASLYENFPGFPEGILGKDLVQKMEMQASKFGAEIKHFEEVVELDLAGNPKEVTTNMATYRSFSLVMATGTQRRKLEVPGETELIGRGVSYCRVCDAPFFRGLKVAVVGFTKGAITDALFLADLAKEVFLITNEEEVDADISLKGKLEEKTNVNVVYGKVIAILGKNIVNAVKISDFKTKKEVQKEVNGVFVSLGKIPATEIVKKAGLETDENGCIKVDRWQRTNIEGVFAAGDCTCGGMQVVTATGEGATASIKALAYVKRMRENTQNS